MESTKKIESILDCECFPQFYERLIQVCYEDREVIMRDLFLYGKHKPKNKAAHDLLEYINNLITERLIFELEQDIVEKKRNGNNEFSILRKQIADPSSGRDKDQQFQKESALKEH